MINLDDIDKSILLENFDEELIQELDPTNVAKIITYLTNNGIYYAKDIFLSSLDLFLLPEHEFIKRFEHLKTKLGTEYIDKLGTDTSSIEIMYEKH